MDWAGICFLFLLLFHLFMTHLHCKLTSMECRCLFAMDQLRVHRIIDLTVNMHQASKLRPSSILYNSSQAFRFCHTSSTLYIWTRNLYALMCFTPLGFISFSDTHGLQHALCYFLTLCTMHCAMHCSWLEAFWQVVSTSVALITR